MHFNINNHNRSGEMRYEKVLITFLLTFLCSFSIDAQPYVSKVDSLKKIYSGNAHDSLRLDALYRLSSAFYPQYDSCINYAELLVNESKKVGSYKYNALAEARLATLLARQGKFEEALNHSRQSIEIPHSKIDNDIIGQLYESQGYVYYLKQNYRSALRGYLKSLEFIQVDDQNPRSKIRLANMYVAIGGIYSRIGKFDLALEYFMKALEYDSQGLLSKATSGRLYNNIGSQYQLLNKDEEALEYMKKAYRIKKELNSVAGQIVALRNMSVISQNLKKLDDALDKMNLALTLATNHPEGIYYLSRVSSSIGTLYQERGEYKKAKHYFEQAIKVADKNNQPNDLGGGYLNLGKLHLELKQYDLARSNINTSLKIQPMGDDQVFTINAYAALANLDSAIGNYPGSLEYYKIYTSLKDSILNAKKNSTIAELEIAYETQRKDNEIILLKKDAELEKANSARKSVIIKAFAVVSGLLAIMLLLLFRQNRIKQRSFKIIRSQRDELEKKNDENLELIKEIHHRVRNNMQIMLSLLNAQGYTLEDDDRAKTIIKESQNRIKSMALIHQNLYNSGNHIMVESLSYFDDLLSNVLESFKEKGKHIDIKTDIDNKQLRMTLAVPLGLILNELITNAFKYAFEGLEHGELQVNFSQLDEGDTFLLQVHDKGIGLDTDFQLDQIQTFGLQMVKGLAEQLDGSVEIQTQEGTKFDVRVMDIDYD